MPNTLHMSTNWLTVIVWGGGTLAVVGFRERLLAADVSDSPAEKRGVGGQFWTDGKMEVSCLGAAAQWDVSE